MSEIISSLLEYFFATSESIFELTQRYKFILKPQAERQIQYPYTVKLSGQKKRPIPGQISGVFDNEGDRVSSG